MRGEGYEWECLVMRFRKEFRQRDGGGRQGEEEVEKRDRWRRKKRR